MDGKKRKVMFLIYSLCGGGAERVLVETVNRLPKDRYDVTLMTLFHDDTRAGMLSPEVHYRPALRVKNGRAQKILSGIMQYIAPTMIFIIAVFVFAHPLTPVQLDAVADALALGETGVSVLALARADAHIEARRVRVEEDTAFLEETEFAPQLLSAPWPG